MKFSSVFLAIIGIAAVTAESPWKINQEYKYNIYSRTFSAMPDLKNQYVGIVTKGNLILQVESEESIVGQLMNMKHSHYHDELDNDWNLETVEKYMDYQELELNDKTFMMNYKNGMLQSIHVDSAMTNDQVNQLKAILSQLQIVSDEKYLIKRPYNQMPENNRNPQAMYMVMEPTITGECETIYDIEPVPNYLLQDMYADWVFDKTKMNSASINSNEEIFQIVKTMNYSNCHMSRGYHYGITGDSYLKPNTNQMGDSISKSSVTKMLAKGSWNDFSIQNSYTTNRVLVSPAMYQDQQAEVMSQIQLTMTDNRQISQKLKKSSQMINAGDLVYRYNRPSDPENKIVTDNKENKYLQNYDDIISKRVRQTRQEMRNSFSTNSNQKSSWYMRLLSNSNNAYSSHSSAEHEDNIMSYYQPMPNMEDAPETPLYHYTVGNQGRSIQNDEKINLESEALKLVTEISENIQSQNDIPKQDTLQKFDILSDLVRVMNLQQIDNVYRKVQSSNEENESISQTLARKTLQDAVAVAGTGPAVRSMLRRISEHQIKRHEAQSSLEDTLKNVRYPTEEMMKEIFEFIRSEPVKQNRDLYSVALISYTNLLRRAHNERSSYNRYPVNVFGSSAQDIEQFVAKEIIPYLRSHLQKSVEQKKERDVLLYLRSIGNLGHHEIVHVYEDYLENNQKLTSFQRTALVLSLDKLTKTHPRLSRNILFKISTNIADKPETRSIAILLLMNADPTVAMLQRIAEMSNNDPSEAVQSIAKSTIESAANLKSSKHYNLANNARSVRHLLNSKRFGNEYSRTYLRDYIAREMNLVHEHQITHIVGDDHIMPKGILYKVRKNYGGFETKTTELQAMVSNIEELLKFLPDVKSESHDYTKTKNDDQSRDQWSIHRIAKQLRMEPEIVKQLEGQILFKIFGRENFMSFDEESLKKLPEKLVSKSELFKNGESMRYNKMYNRKQVIIAFPLATGYPFIYTFNMPTLVQAIGHMQVKTTPDIAQNPSWEKIRSLQSLDIAAKIHLVFYTDQIAKVGFITPFDRQRYVAGNVKKSYVHLPLDMEVNVDIKRNMMSGKLTPMESNKDFNMIESSSWPFTLRKDVFDLRPAAEAKDMKLIVSSHPYVQNRVIGEKSTGMVFDLHSQHHYSSKDRTDMFKTLWNQGIRSLLKSPFDYKNLMENVISEQKPSFWSFVPHTYLPPSYHNTKKQVLLNMITLPYLSELSLEEFIRLQGILSLIDFPFTDFDTLQATTNNPAILKAGSFPWPSRTLDHYRFNVMYDARRSVNQVIKFSFALDKAYNPKKQQSTYRTSNRKEESSLDEKKLSIPQDLSPNSQERRQQFLYNAANGVKQASAAVLDASLVFDGNKKTEYVITVSHAHSPVDEKSRVLVFLNAKPIKPSTIQQIGMTLVAKYPKKSMLSFEDALKQNDKSNIKAYINLNGENQSEPTYIKMEANMEQTDKYRNYLTRENAAGKQCLKEMQAGNYQSSSCIDATYWAGLQDHINLQAEIDNSNKQEQKIMENILRIMEKVGFWNLERYENNESLKANRMETTFNIMPATNTANLSIKIENKKYFFRELPFNKALLSFLNNANLHHDNRENRIENRHTCIVDKNDRVVTFDKNILDTELTKCWYAMVQTKINKQNTPSSAPREISVLLRNNDSQQKELMIVVGQKVGKDHVIRLSENSRIEINGQEKKSSTGITLDVFDDNSNKPSIRVYQQVKGENVVQIDEYQINVYFNGERIRIHMDPKYRGNTYGLCGTFTGEKFDDFVTPQKCILRNNKMFTASWALEDNSCSNEIRYIKNQVEQMSCSKLEYYSGNFVTETETKTRQKNHSEWTRGSNSPSPYDSSEEIYNKNINQQERNYSQENQMKCNMREQIQFIENHEKICFTIDALPACPKHCTAQRKTERKSQVYCRNKDDSVAQLYKQQILKGANPDFSSKSVTKTVAFNVPTSCIAVN